MVGANPTPVAWGETPSAIRQGVADALDPSVGALHVFGFGEILSHVTFTQAVPDSQVYSINLEWFNSLPSDVQEGIEFAGEVTQHQNLSKVPSARSYAMSQLIANGVEFHSLSDDQLAEWQDAGGYQRSEWDQFKVDLAGDMDTFARLEEAAGTRAATTSTTPDRVGSGAHAAPDPSISDTSRKPARRAAACRPRAGRGEGPCGTSTRP
jgi:TRAP-type C4-dicarboxylate transport system substrate-binding protein